MNPIAVRGFDHPESVWYDSALDVYFVSNTGSGNGDDSRGFISRLKSDGTYYIPARSGTRAKLEQLATLLHQRSYKRDRTRRQALRSAPTLTQRRAKATRISTRSSPRRT